MPTPELQLGALDIAIIAAYVAATIGIGFWISKRASKNLRSYFLGGNSIPWYALGLSNASGMFDISGTMLMVFWLFVFGVKSVWIPWLWPAFNQIVMMIYLSVWLRRSNVLTGAEWIRFRFGDGRGAKAAHLVVVAFAMLSVISLLAYGFIGAGKFTAMFVPFELSPDPVVNANLYATIVTALTTLYVVKGGMFSVVFTEVLQFFIMTIACVAVGVIAVQQVSPEMIAAATPDGWGDLFFGWRLDLDWSSRLESAGDAIDKSGWDLFGLFVGFMLVRGLLASAAGPVPGYDMQRVLSARTPKEAALMSGVVSLVLLVPRYLLVTGLTVLALAFYTDELAAQGANLDFEVVLPLTMRDFIPAGLLGLLIAALLAAFMSTFAATVNSAPAYIVNDVYKRYLRPDASDRQLVWMSYVTSVVVVLIGSLIGLFVGELQSIVNWIVAALGSGYLASNVLKWHWWRFNGWGYFFGMLSGILAAVTIAALDAFFLQDFRTLFGLEKTLALFPIVLALTTAACIIGSLATPADEMETLKDFYRKVRPWGAWRPVREALQAEYPDLQPNREFGRDAVNIAVGIAWQTSLTALGIYLVLRDYTAIAGALAVIVAASVFLKFNWYDKLTDEPRELA